MKKLFLSLIFIVGLPFSAKAEWTVMKLEGAKAPTGLQSFMILENMIRTEKGDFSTGIITNSVLRVADMAKLKIPNQTPDQMAEEIRVALKAPAWTHSQVEGLHIYTMKWPEQMAYFRLVIQKDRQYVRTSFANLRPPYAMLESVEADLLQRAFFKLEKRKFKKTTHYWQQLFEAAMMSEAQAVELNSDTAFQAYEGFMNRVDQISQNVARQGIREFNATLLQVSGDGIAAVDRATNMAGVVGADVSGSIRGAGQSVENAANTARDALRETMKFTNAAKFGLGLGLGFGVGSAVSTAVTNLFLGASGKMVRNVYYYALGKMKPEDRAMLQAKSDEAFDDLEKHSQKIEDIQRELMKYEMAFASAVKLPPQYLIKNARDAQIQILDLKLKIEKMMKEVPEEGEARLQCLGKVTDFQNQLAYSEMMFSVLKDAGSAPSKDMLCNKMRDLLGSWVSSEAALHRAKLTISLDMTRILAAIRSKDVQSFADPVSQRAKINECVKTVEQQQKAYRNAPKTKCIPGDYHSGCERVEQNMQAMENGKNDCSSYHQIGQHAMTVQSTSQNVEMTELEIQTAKRHLESIAVAHCQDGQKDDVCRAGKAGGLTVIRDSYKAKVANLSANCPDVVPPATDTGFSSESLAQGMPASDNELRNVARAPASKSSTPKPSFWTNIMSSIKSFFTFR